MHAHEYRLLGASCSEYTLKRPLFGKENKEIRSAFSFKKVYKQLFHVRGILKVLFYLRTY